MFGKISWSRNDATSDFGLPRATVDELKGGEPERNAEIILGLLEGEQTARRDIVIANAAAALLVSQRASDLKSAVALANESIDSGAAKTKLAHLVEFCGRSKAASAESESA